jgi:hypothetical protein
MATDLSGRLFCSDFWVMPLALVQNAFDKCDG